MFSTIIVGTDGSPDALEALAATAKLALTAKPVDVHVVTAYHPLSLADLRKLTADLPEEFHPLLHGDIEVEATRHEAKRILDSVGVDASFHEVDGKPAEAILAIADQEGADLIVLGSRGEGLAKRMLHGSVSTTVFHHAPCSVLIVKADD